MEIMGGESKRSRPGIRGRHESPRGALKPIQRRATLRESHRCHHETIGSFRLRQASGMCAQYGSAER